MNVTQVPPEEATAALAGWLSRSDFQVEVQDSSCSDPVWRVVEKSDSERSLMMRRFEHVNALALSYTLPLAQAPRLKKLELVCELNDSMAFARFSLHRNGDLQVEYMISCANDYLPACLAPVVNQLIDMATAIKHEIEMWGLDVPAGTPLLPPGQTSLS